MYYPFDDRSQDRILLTNAKNRRPSAHQCPRREPQHAPELVIITGMSGSGKASVLKAFEDLGYYCVDNLPVGTHPAALPNWRSSRGEIRRTALVVDVREGSTLERLPEILKESSAAFIPTKVVYPRSVGRGAGPAIQ